MDAPALWPCTLAESPGQKGGGADKGLTRRPVTLTCLGRLTRDACGAVGEALAEPAVGAEVLLEDPEPVGADGDEAAATPPTERATVDVVESVGATVTVAGMLSGVDELIEAGALSTADVTFETVEVSDEPVLAEAALGRAAVGVELVTAEVSVDACLVTGAAVWATGATAACVTGATAACVTGATAACVTGAAACVTGAAACVTGAAACVTGAAACVTGAAACVTGAAAADAVPTAGCVAVETGAAEAATGRPARATSAKTAAEDRAPARTRSQIRHVLARVRIRVLFPI